MMTPNRHHIHHPSRISRPYTSLLQHPTQTPISLLSISSGLSYAMLPINSVRWRGDVDHDVDRVSAGYIQSI